MRLCQLNLLSMSYSNLGVHWKCESVRLCQLNLLSMSYSNLGVHWRV